jgi:amino acid permease
LKQHEDDLSSDPSFSPHSTQDDIEAYARLSGTQLPTNRFSSSDPTIAKAGLTGSVFVLCASVLGAGLLTIPQQFYKIGFLPTVAFLLAVALLNFYAIYLLTRAAEAGRVDNYEDVVELSLPGIGSYLLTFLLNVGSFGSLVAFLDIIADILQSVVLYLTPARSFFLDKSFLLLVFTFVFILPLCLLRNISMLKYSSFVATMLLTVFVGVIAFWGIQGLVNGSIQLAEISWGFPTDRQASLFDSLFQVIPTLMYVIVRFLLHSHLYLRIFFVIPHLVCFDSSRL